jgi:hypothetical protein
MSATTTNGIAPRRMRADLGLWRSQALAVARAELRRILSLRSGFWLYFLAAMPLPIIAGHAIFDRHHVMEEDTRVLAGIVNVYYLRMAIFFACLGVFTRLFRGEIVSRTLHYYFLAPLRREVLVAGKFLGGVLGTATIFALGVCSSFAIMYGHMGSAGRDFMWNGPGLWHLGAYLLTTLLACVGYGAVFLALGLVLRNPAAVAFFLLMWETFSGILPSWLQRLTVTFYLKPLLPLTLPDEGPGALFSVVVEPVPAWLAVIGLLLFATLVVGLSSLRIRRLEINYSTD